MKQGGPSSDFDKKEKTKDWNRRYCGCVNAKVLGMNTLRKVS